MATIRDYSNYLIYLCRCAVNGETPADGFPEELDFEKFFQFCYDHQLVGLAYDMISRIKTGYEGTQTMLIFKDKHNYAVLKDASQEYYLGLIKDAFDENGIDYAPLKGAVIKNLYPIPYYRQSTDIDILIRSDDRYNAKKIIEGIGFENELMDETGHTDNYRIDKYGYVELHKTLIPSTHEQFVSCKDIPKRLVLKGNHEYAMTDDDFYLFMIIHIAKHLKWSSVGIRSILDVFVYLKRCSALNKDFIDSELERNGLTVFYKKLLKLVNYWFYDGEAGDDVMKMADYISESGWNGSTEHIKAYVASEINAIDRGIGYTKRKYILSKVFISAGQLKNKYHILEKHPYLVPFCWIHRGYEVLTKRRNSIGNVIHSFDGVDIERSAQIDAMRKSFGL